MKVLISPESLDEATAAVEGQSDIIDIKNVKEGSLGAQPPWNVKKIVEYIHSNGIIASATLGDLPYKPGTAALAAYATAACGADYIKAGLHGVNTYEQAFQMMSDVHRAVRMISKDALVVAAGYADYRRFNGLATYDLVRAAKDSKCDVVMVDTAIKDGRNLFDALTMAELADFIKMAKDAGMLVALAGSIKQEHAEDLFALNPDVIGVRGAVCEGPDRSTRISPEKTRTFVKFFHDQPVEDSVALSA